MPTQINMMDRDTAVALAKAVSDTLAPQQVETADAFETSIARLREQITETRLQISRMESELDALALGGPVLKNQE